MPTAKRKNKGDLSLAEPHIVSRTYALDPTLEYNDK
jgi:hypothetical protein